ncbi:MAG: cell division protein FtsQ/DivIB [Magnetovibrionaceae bacterium]
MSDAAEKKKTKATAKKAPRAAKRPLIGKGRMRRLALGGATAFAVLGTIGLGSWVALTGKIEAWSTSLHAEALSVTNTLGLSVGDVLVTGRKRTNGDALLRALETERSDPILAFDPQDAAVRIAQLPWVANVTVERLLPDTILVRLTEREPLALWQRDGEFQVIDGGGVVIAGIDPRDHAYLPRIVGDDAPEAAPDLFTLLNAEPHLSPRVEAAVRVGGRRWNVRLSGDIDVRLPEQDAAGAWARLAEYDRSHSVLSRDIRVLDLRLPDRLIVRTRDALEGLDEGEAEPAEALTSPPDLDDPGRDA